MNRFGEYLRKLRLDRGLTLLEVKGLSGVSVGYLSELEQGKRIRPNLEILKRLATVYGVTVQELIRAAGYTLDDERLRVFSKEDEIEWAFNTILRDPTFGPFIDKKRIMFMPFEAKLGFIRKYEKMTGRKLLPRRKKKGS